MISIRLIVAAVVLGIELRSAGATCIALLVGTWLAEKASEIINLLRRIERKTK